MKPFHVTTAAPKQLPSRKAIERQATAYIEICETPMLNKLEQVHMRASKKKGDLQERMS
jgi:hypothetical protein